MVEQPLRIASGTTLTDSGLLNHLHPVFEEQFGTRIDVLPRGSGGALRTARAGNCDLVIVHARPLEDAFLAEGHGCNRRTVMVNDFLIVGPPADPAGISSRGPVAAFQAIADAEAPFLSRGDQSGTHLREQRLWTAADRDPGGDWYRETGQGMGNTLSIAAEFGGYTLADRGTFLNTDVADALAPLLDRGIEDPPPLLRNEYAVIPVNPARHDAAYVLALSYVGFITGPGQSRIDSFRIDGHQGFRPIALTQQPDFSQYLPSDWECSSGRQ